MDLRVLHYFLTVAREQSFTKAAEQLNITQPTLSRQLAALEEELGAKLFNRGGHQITLTNEGLLLKRRALEIVDLEDKIVSEFKGNNDSIEGKITIGCGEFLAVESLAKICKNYREKYPLVQFAIRTGTADNVLEMMNKGLVDIGLFLEPVNTQGLDYIRMPENDHWVVTMRPDDPLAEKEILHLLLLFIMLIHQYVKLAYDIKALFFLLTYRESFTGNACAGDDEPFEDDAQHLFLEIILDDTFIHENV